MPPVRVLINNGSLAGLQATLDLANSGVKVYLVQSAPSITPLSPQVIPKILETISHPNVHLLCNSQVTKAEPVKGTWRIALRKDPRFIDEAKCRGCGICETVCPVKLPETGGKPISVSSPKAAPFIYAIQKRDTRPCKTACPIGLEVQGYVALIAAGKFTEALELIRQRNPLPSVCGRVCTHPCESHCTRQKVDKPVAIKWLKRFAADNASSGAGQASGVMRSSAQTQDARRTTQKVAIIGSGPAGLTAAYHLARQGYPVTIFEAAPVAGGMLVAGIPPFRLPREVIKRDIDYIKHLGVEIKTSTPIGKKHSISKLFQQGYKAVLIATGAYKGLTPGIAGETLKGTWDCLEFLQQVNLKKKAVKFGKRVLVVGGGNAAIDTARTALRLGVRKVTIVYRRTKSEMPANPEEVEEAGKEGVTFEYLTSPVKVVGKNNKVIGLECIKNKLGEPDASGRRAPVPIAGSEKVIPAETIIWAISQQPDLSWLDKSLSLATGRNDTISVNNALATNVSGVFAAGDVVSGPRTVIEAMAQGANAALAINEYINKGHLKEWKSVPRPARKEEEIPIPPDIMPQKRRAMPALPVKDRRHGFDEVELGYSRAAAIQEAQRCLNCGLCSQCQECIRACVDLKAIDHDQVPQEINLTVDAVLSTASGIGNKGPGFYRLPADVNKDEVSQMLVHGSALASDILATPGPPEKTPAVLPEAKIVDKSLTAEEPRLGVFFCRCGNNISSVINLPELVNDAKELNGVAWAGEINYACGEATTREIAGIIKSQRLNRVVLAACSCCSLDQICFACSYQRVNCKNNLFKATGLPRQWFDFINIREQCAWAYQNEPAYALALAKGLTKAVVTRTKARPLIPSDKTVLPQPKVLIIGNNPAGQQVAKRLAEFGISTDSITAEIAPTLGCWGTVGNYLVGTKEKTYQAGAVILCVDGVGKKELADLARAFRISLNKRDLAPLETTSPGIFVCGTEWLQAVMEGNAAALKAALFLARPLPKTEPLIPVVDETLCRGCGTCESLCEFYAVKLTETNHAAPEAIIKLPSRKAAVIDGLICKGCGICIANCPTGALRNNYQTDRQVGKMLEVLLES